MLTFHQSVPFCPKIVLAGALSVKMFRVSLSVGNSIRTGLRYGYFIVRGFVGRYSVCVSHDKGLEIIGTYGNDILTTTENVMGLYVYIENDEIVFKNNGSASYQVSVWAFV